MRPWVACFVTVVLVNSSVSLLAQAYIPLEYYQTVSFEPQLITQKTNFVTSFKPYFINAVDTLPETTDSLYQMNSKGLTSWIKRKLFEEHFINVTEGPLTLTIDPLVILDLGKEKGNESTLYRNTRGILLEGTLGKKLFFSSSFYENQARFPQYLSQWMEISLVAPGQGTLRNFGEGGYDFNWAEGRLTYHSGNHLLLEMGHGKKFIGNGYRSLMLSDNAFNYPYFLIQYRNKWFHYQKIHATLMHDIFYVNRSNAMYARKTGAFHYLGVTLLKKMELSVFEGTIWHAPDSTGEFHLKAGMINPVPLYHHSPDKNIVGGININIILSENYQLYNQWVFDDYNAKRSKRTYKKGYQFGLKGFDPLGIKGLILQAEFNQVLPYTYSQLQPELSYTHYNQPLAHPLGANFREWVFLGAIQRNNFLFRNKLNLAKYGADDAESHWGKDIFKSMSRASVNLNETTSELFQGHPVYLKIFSTELSYIINPVSRLMLSLGMTYRTLNMNQEAASNTNYFYVSLQTKLNNFYYDF